jgi:HK97 gp10 family phage protein
MPEWSVKIEGLDELGETLKELGGKIGTKYLKHSTLACAKVFLKEAQLITPYATGALEAAEATFKRPGATPSEAHYIVGIRRIVKRAKVKRVLRILKVAGYNVNVEGDPFYGRFLEFGFHDKGGNFHKHPFLRPAFDNGLAEALTVFGYDLGQGVDMAVEEVRQPGVKP